MNISDTQFENMQLVKLANSAEVIFQHLYSSVTDEQKSIIDQWLCLKQEYESACNSSVLDSCENLDESSMLSRIDEVSENDTSSVGSSVSSRFSKLNSKSFLLPGQEEQTCKVSNSNRSNRLFCPVRKLDLDECLNEYMAEFKIYTDVFTSVWISNLSFSLLADGEKSFNTGLNTGNNEIETPIVDRTTAESPKECNQEKKHQVWIPDVGNLAERKLCNQRNNSNKCWGNKPSLYLKREIQRLQEVRLPLLQMRRNIVDVSRSEQLEGSSKFRDYLKFEVVIEAIDISIEMKNQLSLGHSVLDKFEINDQADSIIADCLSMLSLDEVKCLLITFLKKVIDIRESSTKLDKEILKQDNFVFYQKLLIRNLNKTINNNKLLYDNQYLTLQKEYEDKLDAMRKLITARRNANSDMGSMDNPESNALAVVRRSELQPSYAQTDFKKIKVGQLSTMLGANVSNVTLKTLQGNNASPDVKVTRQKNKLIIQQERN